MPGRFASNTSVAGREQNRRVEIAVYGNPIGGMPYWAERYSLAPPQRRLHSVRRVVGIAGTSRRGLRSR